MYFCVFFCVRIHKLKKLILLKKIFTGLCLIGFLASCGVAQRSYPRKIKKETISESGNRRVEQAGYRYEKKEDQPQRTSESPDERDESTPAEWDNRATMQKAEAVVEYAKTFLGTHYRYGGMSPQGIDCSGLVHLSFLNGGDIDLPRQSREIAREGQRISQEELRMGDLVFFKTMGSRYINHLGIVVENSENGIWFIHASRSRGVMVSALNLPYWSTSYEESRRIL